MPDENSETSARRYVVATDGACKGNPGPTGWAWVGEDGEWAAGSLPEGTNNIGELLALLNAIVAHADVDELIVQADSKYAIDTYASWMDGHRRRGWVTSAKKPVANRDILEQLIAARDARRSAGRPDVVLEHVRGHAGHRLNSWADERAVRASQHGAAGEQLVWTSHRGLDRLDVSVDPPRAAADRVRR
ncbi:MULTISPECIES: ribonuclease H family protein [Microbacterium]|uniref:ribonuclease H n=2 Tax=Microbacterium TaxID=33882 RepID=A0A0F0LXI7_9MICO|nr:MULTISPECIES: ribonuclease H [Microbacterium]KJL36990.1 Ribonuclease H [Microbacterium ginsengisoli]MBN9209499.1 ribonuclease HI [Microbacterium ginsengisoli]MCK9915086.1 ribonuclease HI [Microbacteriaceae bacterium K1510]